MHWDPDELLASVELAATGGKSEAWVTLTGRDGGVVQLPAGVLLHAASEVQGALLSHVEHSAQGMRSKTDIGGE